MIKEALALLGVVGMASAATMPSAVPANAADNGEIVVAGCGGCNPCGCSPCGGCHPCGCSPCGGCNPCGM
jgi:hypothetical protein